ncbi:MAG: hypothetical protein M3220_01600 [Chloroflexota bacterium]|nr:hypothetical protein [Chloroflexota bacterium]
MIDEVFHYEVEASRIPAMCRIRIFPLEDKTVVVATELPDNRGMPITHAAEELATQVIRRFNIDPGCLIWIEHYPIAVGGERFDEVDFTWNGERFHSPAWRSSSREEVEQMIGGSL